MLDEVGGFIPHRQAFLGTTMCQILRKFINKNVWLPFSGNSVHRKHCETETWLLRTTNCNLYILYQL